MTRCSHEQSPFQLLYGEPHIFEDLLGLKFRISPDAFFQVNTSGAETLYRAVGELSQADGDTVLLDVCCGTGEQRPCKPGSDRAGILHVENYPCYINAWLYAWKYRLVLYPGFSGTIGLSLARHVSKVVGIEIVEKAIEDARWNAAFNGEFKLTVAEGFKLTAEKPEAKVMGGFRTTPSTQQRVVHLVRTNV